MAVPQRQLRTQVARPLPRNTRGAPVRSASCPWCQQTLPPACCSTCLNSLTQQQNQVDAKASVEVAQRAVAASLREWSRRLALREKHALLSERLAGLHSAADRRSSAVRARRRHLEARREDLRERRRRHEARASEWAAAWRRLEVKRCRISRDEFLRDPAQHSQTLGAFHIYQELSVVRSSVQAERRRRIAELVSYLPLKWIVREDAGADRTVSLAQVQSFGAPGVLQDDELKDIEAALSFLLPLVSLLAVYLDVTLPFPCTGARGHEEARAERSNESCDTRASVSSVPRPPHPQEGGTSASKWVRPCVLHPFTGRWSSFSIYDGICTPEFTKALRLLDEDLQKLCACQGEVGPVHYGTLQLLASILSAVHLGCVSPPLALQESCLASVSLADTSSLAGSSTLLNTSSTQIHDSLLLPKPRSRQSHRPEYSAGSSARDWEDDDWTVIE